MVIKLNIDEVKSVSRLRCVASQILACMAPNLLLLDLSLALSFSTIVIPRLLNAKEGLSLNQEQASWFGSIYFLAQPIGAIVTGPMVDYLGRKKANFLANIPHLVAWIVMHFAWNLPSLFFAHALLGIGTGIMEAPINAYVGEVCEPSLRGTLFTATQVFSAVGSFLLYLLALAFEWREVVLFCIGSSIICMLFALWVPNTPVWLQSHGYEEDAVKALCFLRGWTTPENVKQEYDELVKYANRFKFCIICYKTKGIETIDGKECEHDRMNCVKRYILKLKYSLFCKDTMRPFTLIMVYFTVWTMSGLFSIRPNLENVCNALGMAGDAKRTVFYIGIITAMCSGLVVIFVRWVGKRKLAITSMLATAICCLGISIYARNNLDESVFSYDPSTFPSEKSYTPLVLIYLMTAFTGFGLPWVLIGEVFPFRCRATAQGLAAAGVYVIMFLGSKTLINLERSIHLSGTLAVYGTFALCGTIYLYFFLPETEGKSLQEIEEFYKGKMRIFPDDPVFNFFRKIRRKKTAK